MSETHSAGLQTEFYSDRNVLTISLHASSSGMIAIATGLQFHTFTGLIDEVGAEGAEGFNINIPFHGLEERLFSLSLPHLSLTSISPVFGDSEYLGAFYSIVLPIANAFRPDLVIYVPGLLLDYGSCL